MERGYSKRLDLPKNNIVTEAKEEITLLEFFWVEVNISGMGLIA